MRQLISLKERHPLCDQPYIPMVERSALSLDWTGPASASPQPSAGCQHQCNLLCRGVTENAKDKVRCISIVSFIIFSPPKLTQLASIIFFKLSVLKLQN